MLPTEGSCSNYEELLKLGGCVEQGDKFVSRMVGATFSLRNLCLTVEDDVHILQVKKVNFMWVGWGGYMGKKKDAYY